MALLKECKECQKSYHYQSGRFSQHLKNVHNLSLRDYILKYEYNETLLPKCKCGYCDEITPFYRGKFKENFTYQKHKDPKWKKEQYVKKYGQPKCRCGNNIESFPRGLPLKFCNDCIKKNDHHRFNEGVFKKGEISGRDGMMKKYGITSGSQLDYVRKQLSKRMIEYNSNWKKNHTIKKYKNTDLYYQSLYELDFLELCESNNILDKIKNGNYYNYLEKDKKYGIRLITDFLFDNKYEIEIKSSYILTKQGGINKLFAKKNAVESNNKKYIFILDKNYNDFLEIIG